MGSRIGAVLVLFAVALAACEAQDGAERDGASGAAGTGGGGGNTGGGAGTIASLSLGQIGSGDGVQCPNEDQTCEAGFLCCSLSVCHDRFELCRCLEDGDCTASGCDGPEDCSGGVCCATRNPRPFGEEFIATSCKPACGTDDAIICSDDADCNAGGSCYPTSIGPLRRCF